MEIFLLLIALAAALPQLLHVQLKFHEKDELEPTRVARTTPPAYQLTEALPHAGKKYWQLIFKGFLYMLPAWIFMPPWLVFHGYALGPTLAICVTNIVSSILTINSLPPQDQERNWLPSVRVAVKNIARDGVSDLNIAALHEGSNSPYPAARMAMIEGLTALGNPACRNLLKGLASDPEEAVRTAATAALAQRLPKVKPTLELTAMVNTFLNPPLSYYKLGPGQTVTALSGTRLVAAIDEIVLSQGGLRAQYPNVLCKDCLEWADCKQGGPWKWLECPNCRNAEALLGGVKTLVGCIGGQETGQDDAGQYRVMVWDEAQHEVLVAPLQALCIQGGQEVNYDWAVVKLLDKMLVQYPNYLKGLKVRIEGAVKLEPNTLRLLRQYCAGVTML